MTRSVDVYFKSENDAESARASLQKVKATNVFIDEMPGDIGTKMYIPLFPTNIGVSGTQNNVGPIGANALLVTEGTKEAGKEDQGRLTHLLHLDVNEDDYDQVFAILKEHDCYSTMI